MNRTDVIAADVLDVCLKQAASPLILFLFLCPSFENLWNIESRAFDGNQFPVPKRLLFYMNCEMIKPHSLINLLFISRV